MKRTTRILQAKETLAICEQGYYVTPKGNQVRIANEVELSKNGTVLYDTNNLPTENLPARNRNTVFTVANETAFNAIQRMADGTGHVACLNFASAKNAGGGFLNGAQAQEEALARASALYPCLLMAPEYYERNRSNHSAIYLDLTIFTPNVPFFRDDEGNLIEQPAFASVITAPAPNAGAVAQNEPHNLPLVEPMLKRRSRLVLQVARLQNVDKLILGAWGCGVFRNDPGVVAETFSELLRDGGEFLGSFSEVAFAVLDTSESQASYRAFAKVFARGLGSHAVLNNG